MTDSAAPRSCLAIVLAAGEGTRMRSARPKVLHEIAGRSMLAHAMAAVAASGAADFAVIVGPNREDVAAEARRAAQNVEIFVQAERLGTAHAVLTARAAIARGYREILVIYADLPLLQAETLRDLRACVADGAAIAAMGFRAADPSGYGRLVEASGRLIAIREHRDATASERAIDLCNAGPMAIDGDKALTLLDAVKPDNAQREYYLTDLVGIANHLGLNARALIAEESQAMGVNDRVQLAHAEAAMQQRLRRKAMLAGATMIAPETVYLSFDAQIGRDVVIEPHVVIGKGVEIADGAIIHAFSHLEGARLAPGASIGPYARLRPGTDLGQGAKVGNFVEVKNAIVAAGAKINHLSYIGDASVGAGANIGAGTITCNYDGFSKFRTQIGAGAFIGSNSALVAPVTIGAGAYVGSGSVITKDVATDALAVARGRQIEKPGWAASFRARQKPKKGA